MSMKQFQHFLRSLFTAKPKPVTYNPMIYLERTMVWSRRRWKLLAALPLIFLILGVSFELASQATVGGVSLFAGTKTGGAWDFIWRLRGQAPGWEKDPDGFFAARKIVDPAGGGVNGPLKLIFFPLEFLLVDLMIYLPALIFGGINLTASWDVVPSLMIKIIADYIILLMFIIPFIVGLFLLAFFGPFIFMRLFNSGNIILRGIAVLGILAIVIAIIFTLNYGTGWIKELFPVENG